jgi:hypothetical protein
LVLQSNENLKVIPTTKKGTLFSAFSSLFIILYINE